VPVSAPSVDNDLLSSLGETLLAFEHLFDTRNRGVSRSRVRKRAILLALSRFWKPIAPISAFLATIKRESANLAEGPRFGYSKR